MKRPELSRWLWLAGICALFLIVLSGHGLAAVDDWHRLPPLPKLPHVPEIEPRFARGGLALLAIGTLVLIERFRLRRC